MAQAVAAALAARESLRLGRDPVLEREAQVLANKQAEMTLGQLIEEYLEKGTSKLRANSSKKNACALGGKWFADWRSRPLSWITQGRVDALGDSMPATAASSPLSALGYEFITYRLGKSQVV